jgi:mannitol operon repressor
MSKQLEERPKLRDDWESFINEFAYESDRASAVLGAAYLDELLEKLIASFLIDDKKAIDTLLSSSNPYAPLGSFSTKIIMAYCLGLIDKIQFDDLNILKRIRNLFAHGIHGLDFQNEKISSEIKKPKTHRMMKVDKDLRGEFVATIAILSTDIEIQAREAVVQKRSMLSYYGFIDEQN